MNCATLRLLLPYLARREELAAEDWAAIDSHLANCDDCRILVERERAFDQAVARAMRDVEVPIDLRGAIELRLASQQRVGRRLRLAQWATVTASLLLVAALAWRWYSDRPLVDPAQWAQWEDQQFVLTYNGSRESVIEFFQSRGLKTFVPADFDYTLLTRLEVIDIDGRAVASMTFQKGRNRAKVYVIPRRKFRLPDTPTLTATGSHCTVEVVEVSREYLLVIVYFGEANRQLFFPPGMIG